MSDNLSKRKRLFLIDTYAIFYRAHFAMIRNPLINSKGMHTSALFGFANHVLKLLRNEKPDYLMAASDSPQKTFRHKDILSIRLLVRKCLKKCKINYHIFGDY